MRMKESDPFYHTTAWKKARAAALLRDHYLCVPCLEAYKRGEARKPRQATTVHHIIPRTERPDLSLDLDNLQSICALCHNQMHPEKGRGADRPTDDKARRDGVRIIRLQQGERAR